MGKIHRHDVSFPCFFADLLPTSYVCLKFRCKDMGKYGRAEILVYECFDDCHRIYRKQ